MSAMQGTIDDKTEAQIQSIIEENMNSEQVQTQISEGVQRAAGGKASLKALKQQLDSYNTFYNGILSYTAGVDQANSGAMQILNGTYAVKNGSGELANGSSRLKDGTGQLNSGAIQLKDGFAALKDGTGQLKQGSEKLAAGTGELSAGAVKLSDGSGELFSGIDTLHSNIPSLRKDHLPGARIHECPQRTAPDQHVSSVILHFIVPRKQDMYTRTRPRGNADMFPILRQPCNLCTLLHNNPENSSVPGSLFTSPKLFCIQYRYLLQIFIQTGKTHYRKHVYIPVLQDDLARNHA